jgi:hypothetical protein
VGIKRNGIMADKEINIVEFLKLLNNCYYNKIRIKNAFFIFTRLFGQNNQFLQEVTEAYYEQTK